jgi:hypothetical protein
MRLMFIADEPCICYCTVPISIKISTHPLNISLMSFSMSDSTIPMRRKRTTSERVTGNGDPLVVRKKAREAAKQGASTSVTSEPKAVFKTKKVWV